MNLVAVFFADETTLRRLTIAFRTRCAVRSFESVDAARGAIESGQVISIIVDLRRRVDIPDLSPIELIAQLHTSWPSVPVVGYTDFTPYRAREILAAAHAGASEIILADTDELDTIAGRIVDMGLASHVLGRVEAVTRDLIPEQLRPFLRCCIENARFGLSVDSIVARLQRRRKTLSHWLMVSHLPPPARIVGWARILVAARMLEDTTQSTERVARVMNFVSGTSLRNMMRRYARCGPETLRLRGGFEYALDRFVEAIETGKREAGQRDFV